MSASLMSRSAGIRVLLEQIRTHEQMRGKRRSLSWADTANYINKLNPAYQFRCECKLYALLCAVACLVADLQGVLVPSAVKVRRSDEVFVPRYPKVCDMPVSLRFCGILIVCSSGLSCGRCRHVQHLREVQGFRSAVLELANLLFSFRDSDSPSEPTKGSHGGAPHTARHSQLGTILG